MLKLVRVPVPERPKYRHRNVRKKRARTDFSWIIRTRVKVLGFLRKIQVKYGGVPVVPKPIYRVLYGNPIENGVKNTKSPSH